MHNAAMCTLSLYDVIGITGHLHSKLKSFSNIAKPLYVAVIAKRSVIMSAALLVDVSMYKLATSDI